MGIFSKVWKGIKKVGKKIGKGIKKVFGKVASAFGKLGIVGQLALGFLMPYALGALSSFAGAALGKIGTWSATLIKSSNLIAKTVGYGLKAVHVAGTTIGKMYTSVTETLSAGVDRAKEFFGFGPTETVDLTKNVNADLTATIDADLTRTLNTKIGDVPLISEGTLAGIPDPNALLAPGAETTVGTATSRVIAGTEAAASAASTASTASTTNIVQDFASGTKELFSDINVFDSGSKIRQDVADFSAYDYAKTTATGAVDEAFTSGVVAAGTQKVASKFGFKIPNSNQTAIYLPEMQGANRNVGQYNEATLWAQKSGNNFLTQSFRPRDYVAEAFGASDEVADYFSKMASFKPIGA